MTSVFSRSVAFPVFGQLIDAGAVSTRFNQVNCEERNMSGSSDDLPRDYDVIVLGTGGKPHNLREKNVKWSLLIQL